jgi:glycosyltransferase involved in cell wall biosynthesis
MKISIIGTAYPMRGGIAQYNSILFKYLSEKNDVKIFSFKRQYPEIFFPGKTQYEDGEPAYKIPEDKNIRLIDSVNPFNWLRAGFRLRSEKPDMIVCKYWMPFFAPCYFTIFFIAKIFRNTKVLLICDNIIPHEKMPFGKLLTKILFSTVNYFVVQSRSVEKDLKLFNKKNKPYVYSPHPVYNIFGEKTSREEAISVLEKGFNLKIAGEKILLFFGYIRKYKGLMVLIDAMPEVLKRFNVTLIVAGEFYDKPEPYLDRIKELHLENNIKVVSDFIPDDKIRYFFSASDCVVLPYIDATQSGIAQIAYYYDKPAIASNVGGLSEVVLNDKTGIIIPPGNPSLLAQAIIRFYEENLVEKFSDAVRQEKENYKWENFVDKILNLYENKQAE